MHLCHPIMPAMKSIRTTIPERRRGATVTRRLAAAVVVVATMLGPALGAPAFPAGAANPDEPDSGVAKLESALREATDALVAVMAGRNPLQREHAVAALPLTHPADGRPRMMGMEAAGTITQQLRASGPVWLTVQNWLDLPTLLKVRMLKYADVAQQDDAAGPLAPVEPAAGAGSAALPMLDADGTGGLLRSPDLIIMGTTADTRSSVQVQLRLVVARTGSVVAAESFGLTLTPGLRDLLRPITRGRGGASEDVAPVSKIDLHLTALRSGRLAEPPKEWTVKQGEVLKAGDLFNIQFAANADACVYIFMYGSDRKAQLLFPTGDLEDAFRRQFSTEAAPQENYCRWDWTYTAPGPTRDGGRRFYKLDDTPGRNVLYFGAYRREIPDPENVRRRLELAASEMERLDVLHQAFDHVETFEFGQN